MKVYVITKPGIVLGGVYTMGSGMPSHYRGESDVVRELKRKVEELERELKEEKQRAEAYRISPNRLYDTSGRAYAGGRCY